MGITAVARALRVSVHRKNIAMRMAHNCKAHGRPEPSMNFAALFPRGIGITPQFVEYVGMRPSNPPSNVASFKNAESVATAPQLRAAACDGALSASAARNQCFNL